MKKAKIIYNPSSGRQIIQRRLDTICKILMDNGYIMGKFATNKKNDALYETIKCCKEDWDLIIACGGDGTVNEIAAGTIKGGRKIPVAILGAGTVNDFANYMGLPRSPREFCDMVLEGKQIDVDLGKIDDRYFVNVAASGLLTNVAYQVQPELKTMFGRMAYYIQGLMEIPKQKLDSIKVEFESDEYSRNEDVLLFLISNTSSIGGFKKLAPRANVSDGYLDSIIIKKSDIQDLFNIFINIFKGEHINHPNVEYFRTKKISVKSDANIPIDIDGEYGGKLPATFEVISNAFRILVK